MSTIHKTAAWVGLIMSFLVGLVMIANLSVHQNVDPNAGAIPGGTHVEIYPWAFTNGAFIGANSWQEKQGQLVLNPGTNQASFTNPTGGPIYVDLGFITIGKSVASSTMLFYVGTSTPAALPIADKFNGSTAPFQAQFINGQSMATSSTGVVADNILSHTTSRDAMIAIQAGQTLTLVMDAPCTAVGNCETATSTNRGFSTATLYFDYFTPF